MTKKNVIKNAVTVGAIGSVAQFVATVAIADKVNKKYGQMPCASAERAALLSGIAKSELETNVALSKIVIAAVCLVAGAKMNKKAGK